MFLEIGIGKGLVMGDPGLGRIAANAARVSRRAACSVLIVRGDNSGAPQAAQAASVVAAAVA